MALRTSILFGALVLGSGHVSRFDKAEQRVETLVHRSMASQDDEIELLRLEFQTDPARVVRALVAKLDDGSVTSGDPAESTTYTACGNALTLLEDFTDLRLDDVDREWIGFRVHDHRNAQPGAGGARVRWEAWLRTREGVPVERWFHGLSARELFALQVLVRKPAKEWKEPELAHALELGRRANAFLLAALLDSEWACAGERVADQANRLLARVNGGEPEPVERHALLEIDPADPLRAEGTALVRNRIALHALHERWSVRLLAGK
ncbi:MAG: hypothetical protein IPJ77_23585 [Planctomycetes bacterium]|nr:hypothetical protein [Planctomycetota bacterium]